MNWPDRGRLRGYWVNILLGWDQSFGTFFGIDADECISSYVGRTYKGKWQEKIIDWIFLKITGEINHCQNSIEN